MSRVLTIVLLVALVFLFACKGGGGIPPAQNPDDGRSGTQDPPSQPQPDDGSTLEVVFVSATPQVGPTPLKVDFLAVVRGGTAPYNFYWDFTNDGAPDSITNNATVGTVSASYTYPFLMEDLAKGLTQSTFTARMWVTDSRFDEREQKADPATRISEPVTVVVTSGSSFKFDPAKTGILNYDPLLNVGGPQNIPWKFDPTRADELSNNLDFYTFRSGDDIRFLAEAVEGSEPYKYRWNFNFAILKPGIGGVLYAADIDYSVDSTLPGPHFAFSYNKMSEMGGEEANYRVISLQAIDSLENTVQRYIGVKIVPTEFTPPPPPVTFKVFVVTSPPVTLDDDPAPFSSADVPVLVQVDRNDIDSGGVMRVPPVNFSATVSTTQGES